MNLIETFFDQLLAIAKQPWVRDMALLIGVSLVAYLPGWFTARAIRKREESPKRKRSQAMNVGLKLLEVSVWPIWALILLYVGFGVWVHVAPESAGDPFRVLPIIWFFFLYRILKCLTRETLPPGSRRKAIRRGVIPLVFILAVLQQLALLGPLVRWLGRPFVSIGRTEISVVSLAIAVGVVLVFLLVARLIAVILGSRILPGLGFDRTLSENLATLFRYALVAFGLFVAVDTLGFDLSALKIALGALGVGIGFGLQGVVNNFVSGLIMLVERTVKKGDIITVGGTDGRVINIGLRSSIVRTRGGREIIVPNSDLVSSQVTNYSYRDTLVRVDISVGVSYGSDPNQVRDLLLQAAKEEARILDNPLSDVVFQGYGNSSIDFELRVWIDDAWQLPQVRSALYFSIWYKLKAAGIEIPFPQRDLHMRSGELKVQLATPGKTGGVGEE
ncbi:MAG: mechanosensitive ion channel [Proteobacteria bacterium]|nr:mechanosensitive ion channel [Pseudomonadota bacterium]